VTEWTLEKMLDIFDVEPAEPGPNQFLGDGGGGERPVIDGSQILAQALVAAGKALPGRTVRSAHAVFVGVGRSASPLEFTVTPLQPGRSFAGATVTATQGERTCVSVNVLLDRPQPDLVRHDRPTGPAVAGPQTAHPVDMPLQGRQLRIEEVLDPNSPDEVGPPIMDAWLHYDTVPARDDLRRALLTHFTGHLSISTTLRAHPGFGTSQSHQTISTAPMAISVSFHDPVQWDGWIRYHHESTYAGAGMCYVRGQVLTGDGRLLASFSQDALVRAFEPRTTTSSVPGQARL
jgi:acyl-CoA thioesterase-2